MTVSRFHVAKMDCVAEEQLVRIRLDSVAGVHSVSVDLVDRTVSIEHATDPADLIDVLEVLDLGARHLEDRHGDPQLAADDRGRQRTGLRIALAINAAFFVVELATGLVGRSLGLVADALDMGADASVYALSLVAVGRSVGSQNRLAAASGYLQLGLAATGLAEVMRRFVAEDQLPDTTTMIIVSALALAGNVATLVILQRIRSDESHIQASWIFTANDIRVNALVILAAVAVIVFDSAVPDLIAGAAIFMVVANGARRILRLTR